MARPNLPTIDVNEYGATRGDVKQSMNRRLFMQLQVFSAPAGGVDMAEGALKNATMPGVVYADVHDPRGVGILSWSEDPADFITKLRPEVDALCGQGFELKPDYSMLGRSYALGHEQDLAYWILERPAENASNPELDWAVWYPLRRKGAFEQLEHKERMTILHEHSLIGRAYGAQDLANDIRLACHGIDTNDNDFVIGLVGRELHPLSHVVASMRKTVQTSLWMEKMGPFFIGHVQRRVDV